MQDLGARMYLPGVEEHDFSENCAQEEIIRLGLLMGVRTCHVKIGCCSFEKCGYEALSSPEQ